MIIRCCAGAGHCGYPSGCSKIVADNFPKERRTIIQSLMLSISEIRGILKLVVLRIKK